MSWSWRPTLHRLNRVGIQQEARRDWVEGGEIQRPAEKETTHCCLYILVLEYQYLGRKAILFATHVCVRCINLIIILAACFSQGEPLDTRFLVYLNTPDYMLVIRY